jgi:hypothetical protein
MMLALASAPQVVRFSPKISGNLCCGTGIWARKISGRLERPSMVRFMVGVAMRYEEHDSARRHFAEHFESARKLNMCLSRISGLN